MLDQVILAAALALSLAGKPAPRQFLAVDAQRHRVTITLIASYDGTNNGFNFDGYSRFLLWTVPRGWTVRVVCTNRGPLRHSCAVVKGADSAQPAFRGAGTPQPRIGLEAGGAPRALGFARAGQASIALPAWCPVTRTRGCGTC